MSDESTGDQNIYVDSDWKDQARAERERLAQQEEQSAGQGQGEQEMRPPDFQGLVGLLASQAVMYLGGVADRESGQAVFDPAIAQHLIDLLGVLDEKTEGNLTEEESRELKAVLKELRNRYVELSKMAASQQAQSGGGQGGGSQPPESGGGSEGPSIVTP